MSDVVVTVSKQFRFAGKKGLAAWLAEGDAPGEPWDGDTSYDFSTAGPCPNIERGERVYVICEDRLVGYAPLVNLGFDKNQNMLWRYEDPIGRAWAPKGFGRIHLFRAGGAVACTIPEKIVGFRGWRYRWWDRSLETPIDLTPWMPNKQEVAHDFHG